MIAAGKLGHPASLAHAPPASAPGTGMGGVWRQGFWLSIAAFLQSGMCLAQSLILSRYFGPGPLLDALSACNGVVRYVNDLVGGLNRSFLQNYTLLARQGSRPEQLFWASQVALTAFLGVVTLVMWIFSRPLLEWIYPGLAGATRAAAEPLLPLLFLGLTFTVGFQISNAKAAARKQTFMVAISQVSVVALTLGSTLLCLPLLGLNGVMAVKVAAMAGASLWLLVWFRQRPQFSLTGLRELGTVLRDGAWLVLLGGMSGGILLLENWFAASMPEGRLTTLAWARQFSMVIGVLLQGGMRQVISVHFQELVRDNRLGELLASVRKIFEYSVVMGAFVALGTWFAGRAGLQILFGGSSWQPEQITRLWEVCSVYSLIILSACLGGLLVQVLVATKSYRLFLLVELLRLGSFTLCAWAWRAHDLTGLALAQVVQQFLGTGLVVFLVYAFLRCKPDRADLRLLLRLGAALAPTALGLWLGQIAAQQFSPGGITVKDAWCQLAVILGVALPGLAATLWLGSRWDISPLTQAARLVQRVLNRSRPPSTQPQ